MLTHLPPLASYSPVYDNDSTVDSKNFNILSSFLKIKQDSIP